MKSLYLYGCGGLGLTVVEIHRAGGLAGYELGGWIDDAEISHTLRPEGLSVVGGGEFLSNLGEADALLICIGDNAARRAIATRAQALGVEFPVAVHPGATLFDGVALGPGSIVNAGAVIARHARLGAHAIVNLCATVGHDVVAGACAQISPGANVAGSVAIGDGVFIGPGAVVIQGRRVGEWATIGAGAVVIRDVEPYTTVFGNPARVVDRRRPGVVA